MGQKEVLDFMASIFKKNRIMEAPRKTQRHGKHLEIVIGIGDDHTAFLTMDSEAYEQLKKMTE